MEISKLGDCSNQPLVDSDQASCKYPARSTLLTPGCTQYDTTPTMHTAQQLSTMTPADSGPQYQFIYQQSRRPPYVNVDLNNALQSEYRVGLATCSAAHVLFSGARRRSLSVPLATVRFVPHVAMA